MKRIAKIIFTILGSLLLLGIAILFWPFTIAGVITWGVSRKEFNRWISSLLALVIVVWWKLTTGGGVINIGLDSNQAWLVQAFEMLGSWIISAHLVACVAQSIFKYIKGFQSSMDYAKLNP